MLHGDDHISLVFWESLKNILVVLISGFGPT